VETDPLAFLAALGREPGPDGSLLRQAEDLIRDGYAHDPAVRAAVRALIDRLGIGLAGLVNILNPDRIILGGLHRALLAADPERLHEVVARRSLWGQSGAVPLDGCTLPFNSLVGAGELAWQPVFDDPLGVLAG
jgi:predicted NBD/HSP70 family sugar kinase